MKKILFLFSFAIFHIASFAQTWSAFKGKTFYLASYGNYDQSSNTCKDPFVCRWGEYITLGQNGILTWNSRMGGANSTYTYTINGKRINLKPRSGSYDVNDKYIELIKVKGDKVVTRSYNGVYRIFNTRKQPVINGPGAEVTSWRIEHNVYRNNQKGLVVHINAQFFNVDKHDLRASAYFDKPENCGLSDQNGQYRGYNGVVCTECNLTNNGDNTYFKDLQLFLPYSELHLGNSGTHDVACHVFIHDSSLGGRGYVLTKTGFSHFNYDALKKAVTNGTGDEVNDAVLMFLIGTYMK